MIKPTIGRVVWFYPESGAAYAHDASNPLAAIITHVWGDRMINLVVFDSNGVPVSKTSVTLLQDGESADGAWCYARWMPYQVEKAKVESATC